MIRYLLISALLAWPAWSGEIYKWTDGNGRVHYGERPPKEKEAEKLELELSPTYSGKTQVLQRSPEEVFNECLEDLGPKGWDTCNERWHTLVLQQSEARAEKRRRKARSEAEARAASQSSPSITPGLNEPYCKQQYGLSCDDVANWREKAVRRCEDNRGTQCDNESYLIDRYKPKTINQLQKNGQAAAAARAQAEQRRRLHEEEQRREALFGPQ